MPCRSRLQFILFSTYTYVNLLVPLGTMRCQQALHNAHSACMVSLRTQPRPAIQFALLPARTTNPPTVPTAHTPRVSNTRYLHGSLSWPCTCHSTS